MSAKTYPIEKFIEARQLSMALLSHEPVGEKGSDFIPYLLREVLADHDVAELVISCLVGQLRREWQEQAGRKGWTLEELLDQFGLLVAKSATGV